MEECVLEELYEFLQLTLRDGKIFILFSENEEREFSNNKTQLGNELMFRTKRKIEMARMMIKRGFN